MRPEYRKKSIRSYVVRAGRMTDGQRKAYEKSWATYGLKLADGAIDTDVIFGRTGPKVLEIGFGMGDSLLQMAAAEPETDFIGIEVHPPGVGTIMNTAQEENISNLRVYLADANDVLEECFAAQSINRLQLYFPDPWHKKKHNKRRIVQPQFVQLVREKLRSGGILHMATDWQHYAEQMLETLDAAEGFENIAGLGEYSPRPAYRPMTKFEKRGQRLGHGVWDLIYKKMD
ncbi:tRNA (guanosine(46)-N7)-methyltransferase TrmB [SAR92 clade bacterium H921]|nr:tRNA (guanosine(46)-N7)-methyltransferase TrmB [SAR92 clade bacterium H921]MDG0972309.1 tRNA (guanosine(46)-N7)-methyltransferase TrmB [Porticoccaceae bacterium]MDG1306700.1 tRNA (guanosine(46)-N7)-methyltransferase TrmB [Porticoccaceae bacterium]